MSIIRRHDCPPPQSWTSVKGTPTLAWTAIGAGGSGRTVGVGFTDGARDGVARGVGVGEGVGVGVAAGAIVGGSVTMGARERGALPYVIATGVGVGLGRDVA